jgi:hypothetical protein
MLATACSRGAGRSTQMLRISAPRAAAAAAAAAARAAARARRARW